LKVGLDEFNDWMSSGVKYAYNVIELKSNGFEKPSQYLPYKNIKDRYAVKLHEWNIKPDKLVTSMLVNETIGDRFTKSKDVFVEAYKTIDDSCDVIEGVTSFQYAGIDSNNDKCYLFSGKMIQRLDKESFFGNTRRGLVSAQIGNKLIFVTFNTDWDIDRSKTGVIKGNGAFSYTTTNGFNNTIPSGEVIYEVKL
jgi:hypothetical protein